MQNGFKSFDNKLKICKINSLFLSILQYLLKPSSFSYQTSEVTLFTVGYVTAFAYSSLLSLHMNLATSTFNRIKL
jgi:hypothetical protein